MLTSWLNTTHMSTVWYSHLLPYGANNKLNIKLSKTSFDYENTTTETMETLYEYVNMEEASLSTLQQLISFANIERFTTLTTKVKPASNLYIRFETFQLNAQVGSRFGEHYTHVLLKVTLYTCRRCAQT